MNRAAVLSILLIIGLVPASLPLGESIAYWSNVAEAKRHRKSYRRHSRAWWRRRRALLRRRRALRESRERQQAEAAQMLRRSHGAAAGNAPVVSMHAAATTAPAVRVALPVPASWSAAGAGQRGELRFNVMAGGRVAGVAAWSRVLALPGSAALVGPRTKTLGGVPTTSLRRTVIDRMIAEGGWVINDLERHIGGRNVFVVLAQNGGAAGARQTWTFYFTELEGQIYSLATTAPVEFGDQLAAQSEQFVAAVNERPTGGRQAAHTTR